MTNQNNIRELFRQAHVSAQLRRLAMALEGIANQIGEGVATAGLDLSLEESQWMLECIDGIDDPDVAEDLAALRRSLDEWRLWFEEDSVTDLERTAARDRAGSWADRLMWVSGLLEATE